MHLFFVILAAAVSLSQIDTRVGTAAADSPSATDFGSGGEVFGNCVPCVGVPNQMTSWTAQTRISEVKGVAPYYYEDGEWLGFRASHWLIGSAVQDYGSFYILPGPGPLSFDHGKEVATPAFYSYDGNEITALAHSAIMRFSNADEVTVGIPNRFGEGGFTLHGDGLSAGNPVHRFYAGKDKPAGFSGWIYIRFNRPVVSAEKVDSLTLRIRFAAGDGGQLLVKAGTSFSSAEAALANLDTEIPGWDFDAVRTASEEAWKARIGQVEAEGDEYSRVHFYTSLWRASQQPRLVSDCGAEPDYDDFSMWDTFRSLHPLLTLLHPQLDGEMMQALVRKYERGGWLPIFPMWGSYTSAMIGDHCISAIVDAYTKGIRNFDTEKAWEAVRRNCFETPSEDEYIDGKGRRALDSYMRYGYIPVEDKVAEAFHKREQCSRTLEYAYDDWCALQLARDFGTRAERRALKERAGNWRNVFDPLTLYPKGRHEDGSFITDTVDNFKRARFITEGSPCHYSWYVPHDVRGLVRLFGKREFEARLDSMFTERRYWHGNEPCHQIPYLYDYIGRPSKAQAAVSDILRSEYRNTPGGLSGNDDAGAMSAWYVFSSLGLYPVCPGSAEYALGLPAFDRVTVHLENGRDLTVVRKGSTGRFLWNGRRLARPFISHRRLLRGGTLTFE